jgi:type IV fimbrial biogenesis protein FimT
MASSLSCRSRVRGFTLVELSVVLVIIAVTAAVALPSFDRLIRSNRVSTQANELIASLALARTEAIRTNTPVVGNRDVVLCPSSDGLTCAADWNDGWIVARRVDDAITTVLRHTQEPTGVVITGAEAEIVFDNRGRRRAGPDTLEVRATQCDPGDDFIRTLQINASGQVRLVDAVCT